MIKTESKANDRGSEPGNYTIAMLGTNLYFENPISIFEEVRNSLHQKKCRLIYFSGESIDSPWGFDKQANIQYHMINKEIADGLIVVSNLLTSFISNSEFRDVCMGFSPLPMVSLGVALDGIPSILIDNFSGIYGLVSHLIETHHFSKIAFIKGIAMHEDGEERFSGYTQALLDHSIPLDEGLILQGNYTRESGIACLSELIDKRKKIPGKHFEAIVCANDYMASGVVLELQKRGLAIPDVVAVTGFDNTFFSRCIIPSLTSVQYPYKGIASHAIDTLFNKIEGKKTEEIIRVQAPLVIHASCGCIPVRVKRSLPDQSRKDATLPRTSSPEFFHPVNQKILESIRPTLLIWEKALIGLQQNSRWRLLAQEDSKKHEAWKILADLATQTFHDANYHTITFNMGSSITSTLEMEQLLQILKSTLPAAQIKNFCLCLYKNPGKGTAQLPEESSLILAVRQGEVIPLPEKGFLFPTIQIIPEEFSSKFGRQSWVMLSLFFHDQQLGYLLLDSDSPHENLHYNLRNQISSALMGVRLLDEMNLANEKIRNFNEKLKDENLRIKAEMDVARNLQMSLLPQDVQDIHQDFDISTFMLPAEEVGGDYFDIFRDDNNVLWLGIGDVSGHGLKPGLIMMMVQTIHVALTTIVGNSPRDALVIINRVMRKNVFSRMKQNNYMTCTLFKYLGDGTFLYAGAHLDLLILRKKIQDFETIQIKGAWLNVVDDISGIIQDNNLKLEIGDILILYTDGITEAVDHQGKMLGLDGLKTLVKKYYPSPLGQMKKKVQEDIISRNTGNIKDDMTLVFIQRIN
ncbi:MAG: SpoIIE family protein phosphatase [Spirochaetales bacterium]|nr:SpoIIE family protein phosphatase [Spirochaetales bacterium]